MPASPAGRIVPLLTVLALLALVPTSSAHGARLRTTTADAHVRAGILLDLNEIRRSHGLSLLRLSSALDAAAQQHTDEMLTVGYFSHSSANGTTFWQRIMGYYPTVPGAVWAVGENLLWTKGTLPARQAVALWMASPEHRRNILAARWRQIGIAVQGDEDAPGFFADLPVTVMATDFGVR